MPNPPSSQSIADKVSSYHVGQITVLRSCLYFPQSSPVVPHTKPTKICIICPHFVSLILSVPHFTPLTNLLVFFYSSHRALLTVSQIVKQTPTIQTALFPLPGTVSPQIHTQLTLHICLRCHFLYKVYIAVEKSSPPPLAHHSCSFPLIIPSHDALVPSPQYLLFTLQAVILFFIFYPTLIIEYKLIEGKGLFGGQLIYSKHIKKILTQNRCLINIC